MCFVTKKNVSFVDNTVFNESLALYKRIQRWRAFNVMPS